MGIRRRAQEAKSRVPCLDPPNLVFVCLNPKPQNPKLLNLKPLIFSGFRQATSPANSSAPRRNAGAGAGGSRNNPDPGISDRVYLDPPM